MPYVVGDGSAAKPVTKMLIGNGAGGTVPIKKIMAGTGSSAVEVWPGKKRFRDDFERSDQVLDQSWNWFTIGTSPYFIWTVGGNARMYDDTTDGQRLSWTSWMEDTSTDVHYSKGKIVNIGNAARGTWVTIHGNHAGTDYMGFQWTGNTLQLFTRIADVTTARGAAASKAQVVGDWLEIRTSVHPTTGICTFNGYVNGNLYCTWTDSNNLVARGASRRRVGFGMQRNRAVWNSTLSSQFSEWEGGDF